MKKTTKQLTYAALIAALYVVLTHMQNMLLPDTTSDVIQFRAAEAMCVLAFFTPSAIWGLTVGCFLFNLTGGATAVDMVVGSAATLLATGGMYLTRNWKIKSYPLLGMWMPVFWNALLVGWELTVYIGGAFWLNALYVALGEWIVLLTLGSLLYVAIRRRGLDARLFG